jgi:putative transcriptional regulator
MTDRNPGPLYDAPIDPAGEGLTGEGLTGQALIAMPGIGDPRFERAVIFVCAHNAQHAFGLVINRPVDGLTAPSVLAKLGVKSEIEMSADPVLYGGPVEGERGFVLHTADYLSEGSSLEISGGVALTATRDVLEAMASHNRRPRHSFLALGYAGWGAGQLEAEIRENVWLTCSPDEALLFGHDFEHKWAMALNSLGFDAGQLSGTAGLA